ncbi:acyltransferase domain-containing protein [Breoghania sp. L-A4]|uniref:acyltransferase domain-containing protein n=1 Tax=Breoghania sp. L-A4 TaxID=2304600 RepID=UPI000E35F250|nr:acyltransferase domain-containing protein [Breoghania sp. L-A4]AXS40808.1 acyltransferase domain-containing protein [Breoghania sp. L-A4]
MTATVLLFAGQGCQFPRMGETLFTADAAYRETMFAADRIVRGLGEPSPIERMFSADASWCEDLTVSHPAIFACEWALYRSFAAQGGVADAVLGVSLGEYTALAAAGVYDFKDLLALVVTQARLATELMPEGGLLTVLADRGVLIRHPDAFTGCTLAGTGYARHFTVAGDATAIERCAGRLSERGVPVARLPVPRAFHSQAVFPLQQPFSQGLRKLPPPRPMTLPVYSAATGSRLAPFDPTHLWQLVRDPIDFPAVLKAVDQDFHDARYIDASPSGTLATLISYGDDPGRAARTESLMKPAGRPAVPRAVTTAATA